MIITNKCFGNEFYFKKDLAIKIIKNNFYYKNTLEMNFTIKFHSIFY